MITDSQRVYLKTVATTLQIVVAAMAGGIAVFAAVVLALDLGGQGGGQPAATLVTYLAVAVAAVALVVSLVVPAVITAKARQNIIAGKPPIPNPRLPLPPEVGQVGPLAAVYQTRLIVAAGVLEGAAFFNLIACMIEGHLLSVVAAAVMLLAILSLFPTRSRLEDWIENQLKVIAQLREMQSINAQ
jgi:hypothetical protein